jgi:hypothetical protein
MGHWGTKFFTFIRGSLSKDFRCFSSGATLRVSRSSYYCPQFYSNPLCRLCFQRRTSWLSIWALVWNYQVNRSCLGFSTRKHLDLQMLGSSLGSFSSQVSGQESQLLNWKPTVWFCCYDHLQCWCCSVAGAEGCLLVEDFNRIRRCLCLFVSLARYRRALRFVWAFLYLLCPQGAYLAIFASALVVSDARKAIVWMAH